MDIPEQSIAVPLTKSEYWDIITSACIAARKKKPSDRRIVSSSPTG